MTTVILAFAVVILPLSAAFAQSAPSPTPQPPTGAQSEARQLTSQQVAELREASRLSAEVVKLYNQQKYDEALPLAKTALEIRERVLGSDGREVAVALLNLAELYRAKRKYAEALAMYQRVLPIYEKAFGPMNDRTAIIVDSLAFLSYEKGDYDNAERFYRQALSMRESGVERREVAQAVYRLAEFYRSRADYKKAEPLFLRAIGINDKLAAKDDVEAGHVFERYICFLYESRARIEDARKAEEQFFKSRRDKNASEPASANSGGVLNGKAISLPRPAYPAEASRIGANGVVRIKVLIDENGKVLEAKVLCGHPIFAKPSVEAAHKARFSPTKLSGMPVKVNGIIIYNFGR